MALTQVWLFSTIVGVIIVLILWWRTKNKRNFYSAALSSFIWSWPTFLIEWYGVCVIRIWYDPTATAAPPVPWIFLAWSFVLGIILLSLYRTVYDKKIVLLCFIITTAGTEAFFIATSLLSGKWAHGGGWNPYWGFVHAFVLKCLLVAIDMLLKKCDVFKRLGLDKPGK